MDRPAIEVPKLAPDACLYATYSKCTNNKCQRQHNLSSVYSPETQVKIKIMRRFFMRNSICISHYFFGKCGHKEEQKESSTHIRLGEMAIKKKTNVSNHNKPEQMELKTIIEELKQTIKGLLKFIPRRVTQVPTIQVETPLVTRIEFKLWTVAKRNVLTEVAPPPVEYDRITVIENLKEPVIEKKKKNKQPKKRYSPDQRDEIQSLESDIRTIQKHRGNHNKCLYCDYFSKDNPQEYAVLVEKIKQMTAEEFDIYYKTDYKNEPLIVLREQRYENSPAAEMHNLLMGMLTSPSLPAMNYHADYDDVRTVYDDPFGL